MKKRGNEYRLVILLVFVSVIIFSSLFLGKGITGMAILGENIKPLCTSDADCHDGEVCCIFHSKNAGVCNTQDMCPQIDELTKDSNFYSDELLGDYKQSNEKESTFFQVFLGIVLLVFAIFLFYIILHEDDEEETIPKKRKYKRKRVGKHKKKK